MVKVDRFEWVNDDVELVKRYKKRYVNWFAEIVDQAYAQGVVAVMLGDDMIGELYVCKGSEGAPDTLRWRRAAIRDNDDPGDTAPQGEDQGA